MPIPVSHAADSAQMDKLISKKDFPKWTRVSTKSRLRRQLSTEWSWSVLPSVTTVASTSNEGLFEHLTHALGCNFGNGIPFPLQTPPVRPTHGPPFRRILRRVLSLFRRAALHQISMAGRDLGTIRSRIA